MHQPDRMLWLHNNLRFCIKCESTAYNWHMLKTWPASGHLQRWPYLLQGVGALLWLVQAWWLARVVAALMAHVTGSSSPQPDLPALLWQTALVVAAAGVLRAVCEYAGSRITWLHARAALTRLRLELAQRLRVSSPMDARRAPSGQVTRVWMEQAEAIVPWLARYQAAQWRVLLVPPVIAIVVAWHSWLAALILLCAAPLIPLFMAIIGWRAQAISEEQLQSLGSLHGQLLERLRGLPTLRALHAVDAAARRLSEQGSRVARKTMRVLHVAMLSSAVLELFSALGVALVAVYIGFHLLGEIRFGTWGEPLGLHAALYVLMLAPTFFDPLRELSAVWHDRANGKAAQQGLHGMLDGLAPLVMQPQQAAAPAVVPVAPVAAQAPSVQLRQAVPAAGRMDAAASEDRPGLDLQIPAGAHVAITGPSGSGKSTLLAMVAGLAALRQGEVRIDEVVLQDSSVAGLRQRMAWMGQQPAFFAGTIRSNLHLGRDSTPQQTAELLHKVGLGDVYQARGGYPLGEGGSGVSGGEALRLALARLAVAQDADLLLLDEPTAHLDSATATQVVQALARIARGKTLLVATHDPLLMAAMPQQLALDGHGRARWVRPEAGA